MRIAHFDCFSGISGDMTLAALISAGVDAETIRNGINSLGLPVKLEFEPVRRAGFAALYARIEADEQHAHRHLPDIEAIITRGKLTPKQKELALKIFRRLGEAEATAHGIPLAEVHFHEVGALDSIADIVGSAIGLDLLGVDKFTSRSVVTGSGTIKAEHGNMPVPTPATAMLLKGAPMAPSEIKTELTTPTGAAILTTVVEEWIEQPVMRIEKIGHGAGKRDFASQPNILRLFVGTAIEASPSPLPLSHEGRGVGSDQVVVLETNIDDLPAEIIGYSYDLLFAAGALDVFTQPIYMKKNRPGVLLSVICPESAIAGVENVLFRETTTLGIRRYSVQRHKLERKPHTVTTRWGPVQGKLGWLEGQSPNFSPEYEDCARIARQHGVPLRQVLEEAQRAYGQTGKP
jgi:uncharacterized protein (TIGR00299 family) protein